MHLKPTTIGTNISHQLWQARRCQHDRHIKGADVHLAGAGASDPRFVQLKCYDKGNPKRPNGWVTNISATFAAYIRHELNRYEVISCSTSAKLPKTPILGP